MGLACKTELIETIRTGKAQDINGQGRLLFNIVQDEISGAVPAVNGVVKISTGHDFVLGVHEMDHIARYLKTGGLSFNNQGYLQPSKYYRSSVARYSSDEVLAYRAQFAFSRQGFPIPGIVKMTDISAEIVAAIVSADGRPVYQILYDSTK